MQHWHRSVGLVGGAVCIFTLCAFLAGCGGGSKAAAVGPVATITLAPSAVSLNAGDVLQLQVSALDSNKRSVFNQTITYASTNAGVQVSTNGLLCAGTWDSLTTPINCKPAAPQSSGVQSNVTASAQGKTSNIVPVNVHLPITSLTVTAASGACVSQGGTVTYSAHAFDGATDITASVGAFTWLLGNGTIGTLTNFTTSGSAAATNTVIAKLPGITSLNVSANSVNVITGVPTTFAECPVASISITPPGLTTLSATTKTQQYAAAVTDTLGVAVANLPITWSTSQPVSISVTSAGLATALAAGTSSIVASCAPANCNLGFNQPIFSNAATVNFPGTAAATTVYATCNPCSGLTPQFPLVPISTSTNTAGTAISLPQQPRSLTVNLAGTKAYLGSDAGLMIFDTATSTVTGTVTNAPGKVLAISPDGNQIITSDTVTNNTYLFNQAPNPSQVTALGIPTANAADFTPDGVKAYVVSGSSLFAVQPGISPAPIAIGSAATDVAFLASGQIAYIAAAGEPFVQACNNTISAGPGGAAVPLLLKSLPDATQMLAADATNLYSTSVTSFSGGCPTTPTPNTFTTHALGATTTPQQIIVTPDGSHAYITGTLAGSLPAYAPSTGTVGSVALSGSAATTTGSSTLDSITVYVGGSDSKVHVVSVSTGAESTSVSLSFVPGLVAIKP